MQLIYRVKNCRTFDFVYLDDRIRKTKNTTHKNSDLSSLWQIIFRHFSFSTDLLTIIFKALRGPLSIVILVKGYSERKRLENPGVITRAVSIKSKESAKIVKSILILLNAVGLDKIVVPRGMFHLWSLRWPI